jgi:hypothetical protein
MLLLLCPDERTWSLDDQARPLLDNRQNRAVTAVGPCPSYYVANEPVVLTPSATLQH